MKNRIIHITLVSDTLPYVDWLNNYSSCELELSISYNFTEILENSVSIYPNPSSSSITISVPSSYSNLSWDIKSHRSKTILYGELQGNLDQIDLSTLDSDLSFIEFRNKKSTVVKKIVVEQ